MELHDIKAEIQKLRYEQGLTLQEIAQKYGKSIYWVNSRLNKNYEPKRIRLTADDKVDVVPLDNTNDEILNKEITYIKSLRNEGLTYEEIASRINRSIYWVHSRLQGKYLPKGARSEKHFQEERVVPYMEKIGFTGILQYVRIVKKGLSQEADIIANFEGKTYITEVKVHITHHQLQTAIGQLIIQRYAYDAYSELQIALPKETDMAKLPNGLIEYLKNKNNIHFLFVP